MANEQNLRPIKDSNIARELQEKSVVKRKKNAKERRDIRLALEELLEKGYKGKNGEEISGAEAIAIKQMEKALKGDAKAFELVRDTAGQKPVEKIQVTEADPEAVDFIERMMREHDDEGNRVKEDNPSNKE